MTNRELEQPERLVRAGVPASFLEYLHACPICEGQELRHYCRVPSLFNEREFIVYERCQRCGVVLRNPRLPSDYREDRYENAPVPDRALQLKPKNQVHYRYMMRLLRRNSRTTVGVRLLDFGCGSGGFLLEARAAGFDVTGLELNRQLAEHVRTVHGIPVHQGLISDPDFTSERFDVIISSQVFEHLVDPKATLLELRKHLTDQGLLLIEVPNLRHIKETLRRGAVMDDSHIFYFSSKSLPWLLEASEFEVLKIEEGLRMYRLTNSETLRLPDAVHAGVQHILSGLRIKTGLSVLARLRKRAA